MTLWTLDRLSTEGVGPVTVSRNGVPVTAWTYAIVPHGERPASVGDIASTPVTISGSLYVLVGPGTDHALTPGTYQIWARYVDSPEAPVLDDVGTLTIT